MRVSRLVELRGHIIDSLILPRVLDEIMDSGGDFEIKRVDVGRLRTDQSYAGIEVFADSPDQLDSILARLQAFGATPVDNPDAQTAPAPHDGVFPANFYATTNLHTEVKINGAWMPVEWPEMDCGILVEDGHARTIPMLNVKAGEQIVVGHLGIRVIPLERPRSASPSFAFMSGGVSSERPNAVMLHEIAQEIQAVKARGGRILVVGGPAIIHTGAGWMLAQLIESGYVQLLFAGNALATHDIENALFGTSLGVSLEQGTPLEHGHEHHLRAINRIRAAGSIRAAVEKGILTQGVMYACIKHGVEFVLAGSVRDDGPLPDVISDVMVAQQVMRDQIHRGVDLVLMISTMLHSIATGNLLPADVTTVCIDINPAVVTKLVDRGSFQARGLVMDAASFLRELIDELQVEG